MEPLISQPQSPLQRRTNICLNMIVKNEAAVIERLLSSVKNVVDYFVIVDTGSSDDTPERIRVFMESQGIPGEVHFRDWVNFGLNRQQALELAVAAGRCSWLLWIDADEELIYDDNRVFEALEPGVSYDLYRQLATLRYANPHLIDIAHTRWEWCAPVHSYLRCLGPVTRKTLEGVTIISHGGGAKSHGQTSKQKYLRDADLLEQELQRNPNDARSRFYLAQSYRDAGFHAEAYRHYELRVQMGGWPEEVYIAQCEKAALAIRLGMAHQQIVCEHLEAYRRRPGRAEALWQLASYCRQNQRYAEGYLFAKVGKDISLPGDILFVRRDVYDWRLLDEFAVCAYWIGQYQESADAGRRLLAENRYPPADKDRLEKNLGYALAKLS